MDGRWVSEDESYRARGYVKFEGEWMTPAEHEAILRERAAEDARERERREADTRVREAEARAAEAEARAREAEAQAKRRRRRATDVPLWYGWGAGPVYWPTGPIVQAARPPRAGRSRGRDRCRGERRERAALPRRGSRSSPPADRAGARPWTRSWPGTWRRAAAGRRSRRCARCA